MTDILDKYSKYDLYVLYGQFKEFEETSIIRGKELLELKNKYVAFTGGTGAISLMQYELLHTIADKWNEEY